MKTITVKIPARKTVVKGKSWTTESYEEIFTQSESGQWSNAFCTVSEAEVIDVCKKSADWKQIKAENFPMEGF